MSRKLAPALLSLLFVFTMLAKERAVGKQGSGSGASVTGEVSSVTGNIITLAGGLVAIDATNAKIVGSGGETTIAAITPGTLITAMLRETGSGPLAATAIAILRNADVTFTGTVQSVDIAGKQFVLLNQTVKVDANTTFVNFGDHASIADLQANTLVLVEADVEANALVASRITLIAAIPPHPQFSRGTVKSIGTEAWVITVGDHDTTFVVNASTKILGSPKAGDKVEVLYTVDSAHANVALSIIKSFEAPKLVQFTGVVKSIDKTRWLITRDDDHKDVTVTWPGSDRIPLFARAGDRVSVVATENSDGTYTAIAIIPRR
ncbi:MAG: DUF5666 domain-containing protein [Thermoanaerobaculia bacterium]